MFASFCAKCGLPADSSCFVLEDEKVLGPIYTVVNLHSFPCISPFIQWLSWQLLGMFH